MAPPTSAAIQGEEETQHGGSVDKADYELLLRVDSVSSPWLWPDGELGACEMSGAIAEVAHGADRFTIGETFEIEIPCADSGTGWLCRTFDFNCGVSGWIGQVHYFTHGQDDLTKGRLRLWLRRGIDDTLHLSGFALQPDGARKPD